MPSSLAVVLGEVACQSDSHPVHLVSRPGKYEWYEENRNSRYDKSYFR